MKTNGQATLKHGNWRLQFYWPALEVSKEWEIRFHFDTGIRAARRHYGGHAACMYTAGGIVLLGFGIGVDHWKPDQPPSGGGEP